MSSDDIRMFVQEVHVHQTIAHIPVTLKQNPSPPWGKKASKKAKAAWSDKSRKELDEPGSYVEATPDNLQDLVSFKKLFHSEALLMGVQIDSQYEGGQIKEDAKYVLIDSERFPR
jgi:hypothetical protein